MIIYYKYRKTIAALLLLLYVFVAMPVQLFHHHAAANRSVVTQYEHNGKLAAIIKPEKIKADKTCGICSHKYSTYYDDAVFVRQNESIVYVVSNGVYPFAIIPTPYLQSVNKGPPPFC